MAKYLIPVLLLLCCHPIQAQTEVVLTDRIPDQRFDKSEAAIPAFKLTGDSLEYLLAGVGEQPHKQKMVLPDMKGCLDTAYSYLFFNGIKNNPLKGQVPVIWGNYNQTQPIRMWIDLNCNFNFADDGEPIIIKKGFKYIDLMLNNSENKEGIYLVRLSRFNFTNNPGWYVMLDKYYKKTYPNRRFLGPNLCFREQQLRTVAARVAIGTDSICIGLYDGNGNGLYNDAEEDAILSGPYHTKILSNLESDGAVYMTEAKSYRINSGGKDWEISEPDQAGRTLKIKCINSIASFGPAAGKKLSFRFRTPQGKYIKLKKFGCRKTIIYIYDWKNPKFSEDTGALGEISRKFHKKVRVIALYYGDQPGLVKNFVQFGKPPYICGLASKEIIRQCQMEQLPGTIYLKKRRKVKLSYTTPPALLDLLNQNHRY